MDNLQFFAEQSDFVDETIDGFQLRVISYNVGPRLGVAERGLGCCFYSCDLSEVHLHVLRFAPRCTPLRSVFVGLTTAYRLRRYHPGSGLPLRWRYYPGSGLPLRWRYYPGSGLLLRWRYYPGSGLLLRWRYHPGSGLLLWWRYYPDSGMVEEDWSGRGHF